jgi:hypothetical protein
MSGGPGMSGQPMMGMSQSNQGNMMGGFYNPPQHNQPSANQGGYMAPDMRSMRNYQNPNVQSTFPKTYPLPSKPSSNLGSDNFQSMPNNPPMTQMPANTQSSNSNPSLMNLTNMLSQVVQTLQSQSFGQGGQTNNQGSNSFQPTIGALTTLLQSGLPLPSSQNNNMQSMSKLSINL